MVRANGAVSLRELARVVQTSEVTVRRDVRALEAEGLLDRRHGGAVLPGGFTRESGFPQKSHLATAEKTAIADLAAGLVAAQDPNGEAATGATVTLTTSNGQGTTVPANLVGMSRVQASAALGDAGFTNIEIDKSCNPPTSVVGSSDPAPGTAASKSTSVRVTCQ